MTDRLGDTAAQDTTSDVDWSRLNEPLGSILGTNEPLYGKGRAAIRPSDIDTAMQLGMGFSGGGLTTKAEAFKEYVNALKQRPSLAEMGMASYRRILGEQDPLQGVRISRGYTTPAYRGVQLYPGLEEEVNPLHGSPNATYREVYSTANPDLATLYAGHLGTALDPAQVFKGWGETDPLGHPRDPTAMFREGGTTMPLWLNTANYHPVDAQGAFWHEVNEPAMQQARAQGASGVAIRNVWDEPASSTKILGAPQTVYITLPQGLNTIKSRFAREFNPTSPDMMRGAAIAAPSLGAVAAPDSYNSDEE